MIVGDDNILNSVISWFVRIVCCGKNIVLCFIIFICIIVNKNIVVVVIVDENIILEVIVDVVI